jgi:phosphoglycolate phosphatase-like HAD superfamily hydrolase
MRKIFLDLDGTLIDILPRWYKLHCDFAAQYGLPILPYDLYINSKREGMSELDILAGAGVADIASINAYNDARITAIEDERYLAFDILYPETLSLLAAWEHTNELVVVTKRRDAEACKIQLERMGIAPHFKRALFTSDDSKKGILAQEYDSSELAHRPFISDSFEDYQTAVELGMEPIIVGYGCRSAAYFQKRGIGNIITTPQELSELGRLL